jgi:hypothetical protein
MVVVALLLLLLGVPALAHAYIDPSAGSLLLQLVLGGVAGVLVALRLYWKRLTGLFVRRRGCGAAEERDQSR